MAYPQDACCVERNLWFQVIQPYVKNRQLSICPSSEDNDWVRGATPYGPGGKIDYKFKHAVSNCATGRKLSRFQWPAQDVMLNEWRGYHDDGGCGCQPNSVSRRFNCAFFDGHAKVVRVGDTLMLHQPAPSDHWDPHWFKDPVSGGWTDDPAIGRDLY